MKLLSLASVNVKIANQTLGNLSFGGDGEALGTISYSYTNNMFNMETTADGGAAVSHNASRAATITISIIQTSDACADLADYISKCWDNPVAAGAVMTCCDGTNNIDFVAADVFPAKYPDNQIAETPAQRSFQFVCARLVPNEHPTMSHYQNV